MTTSVLGSSMLDAAVSYIEYGVEVFPVWSVRAGRCRCGRADCPNAGKHPLGPLVPGGFNDASRDPAIVEGWWRRYPDANIGTPTSWCVVLDVDPRHGGDATLAALEREHGPLPLTPEVRTGSGGRHIYFAPPPKPVRNSAGLIGAGLDVRGVGGYVLLPPSRHVSGHVYVDDPDRPLFETALAPIPDWLLQRMLHTTTNGSRPTTATTDWATLLTGVPEGERHAAALRVAGHFLGLGLPAAEVEEILLGFAARCRPPFPEAEARHIVQDLAAKHPSPGAAASDAPTTPLGEPLLDFLDREYPDPEPVIERLYPAPGNGVIGGEEKLAKSWYMLAEALAIGLGLKVFDRYAVHRARRVLIIEEEDNRSRTWGRLHALLAGYGLSLTAPAVREALASQIVIACFEGFRFDDDRQVSRLRQRLDAFQPEIVYGDAFRKLTVKTLGKPEVMTPLLAQLDDLARSYAFAWRLVHHYRRQQGPRLGRGSQEIVGGYEIGAWVESSLYFEPVGRSHRARCSVQSKDAPSDLHLLLSLYTEGPPHRPTLARFTAEEDSGQSKADATDEAILSLLRTLPPEAARSGAPGISIEALAAAQKTSDDTVRRALARLVAAGKAASAGRAAKGRKLYVAVDLESRGVVLPQAIPCGGCG